MVSFLFIEWLSSEILNFNPHFLKRLLVHVLVRLHFLEALVQVCGHLLIIHSLDEIILDSKLHSEVDLVLQADSFSLQDGPGCLVDLLRIIPFVVF